MRSIVFLSCDDLSEFVVDDETALNLYKSEYPNHKISILSWSAKNIDWSKFDLAIIRTTWDYTKKLDHFLDVLKKIEESGCRLLNSWQIVNWNSRKTYLKELESKGVAIIKSIFFEDIKNISELENKLKDLHSDKFVLKPVVGASADHIKILTYDQVIHFFKNTDFKENWFVQAFVQEVLHGERSYIFFNNELSHVVKKVPKRNDFRVQEEHGGEITMYSPSEDEIQFASNVIATMGEELLYSRVDVLNTKEGYKLIELELIEPSLYFRTDPKSPLNFVRALSKYH